MPSKEEIAEFSIDNELDSQLALKTNRVFKAMNKELKINVELSQFNIDVCLIFDALIKRRTKEELTATAILIKRQNEYIQIEKEKRMKNKIAQLEAEKTEVIKYLENKIDTLENILDYWEAKGKIAKYKIKNLKEEISNLKEILEIMKGEKK